MPRCYEGVLPYSETGTYDKEKLTNSSAWNVLCYTQIFTNNITGVKYREFGFYDPAEQHFGNNSGMNCFPVNCTDDK